MDLQIKISDALDKAAFDCAIREAVEFKEFELLEIILKTKPLTMEQQIQVAGVIGKFKADLHHAQKKLTTSRRVREAMFLMVRAVNSGLSETAAADKVAQHLSQTYGASIDTILRDDIRRKILNPKDTIHLEYKALIKAP